MNNFTMSEKKNISKGKYNLKGTRMAPKQDKKLGINDVRKLFNGLVNTKGINKNRISIFVKTIDGRYLNIKSYKDDNIKDWDDEEYLRNKVKDNIKFGNFEFVDFYVK